jgi:hypothetical protein
MGFFKDREYFVKVSIGDDVKQTSDRRRKNQRTVLEWDEKITLLGPCHLEDLQYSHFHAFNSDGVKASDITLSLYYHRTRPGPKLVGEFTVPLPEVSVHGT